MRTLAAFAAILILLAACGGAAAPAPAPTANTNTVLRATPTPAAPAASPYSGPSSATVTLADGRSFSFTLRGDKAPRTVTNFVAKVRAKSYDGLTFHRVEPWVLQGGDPAGTGSGGGNIASEYNDLPFVRGAIGIARGENRAINNDMQFFVMKNDSRGLDGNYTNFGQITQGQDVVNSVTVGTKIRSITVQ